MISILVQVFGCIVNPLMLLITEFFGIYKPIEYSLNLEIGLSVVAIAYAMGLVFVAQMVYLMKASWARVALNMQVVVTFGFDILVAGIKFNSLELAGCILLLVANFYLIVVQIVLPEEEEDDVGTK